MSRKVVKINAILLRLPTAPVATNADLFVIFGVFFSELMHSFLKVLIIFILQQVIKKKLLKNILIIMKKMGFRLKAQYLKKNVK